MLYKMRKGTGYCVACEDEIVGSEDEHYIQSPSCGKWKQILLSDKIGATFIQETYQKTHTQLKNSVCLNCDIIYSNIGNLNKHHKKHPECLKINLYKTIYKKTETDPRQYQYKISASTTPDKFNIKEYYRYWPESMYNNDLDKSKDIIIKYLEQCSTNNENDSNSGNGSDGDGDGKKPVLVVGLDDVILFGDHAGVLGHHEMELGEDRSGNDIFILPINVEIKEIMEAAQKLNIYVIIVTLRPKESKAASIRNLKMFEIKYDELIVTENKQPIFEKINSKYKIIMDIGRSADHAYKKSPFSVILPDEDVKYVTMLTDYQLFTNDASDATDAGILYVDAGLSTI